MTFNQAWLALVVFFYASCAMAGTLRVGHYDTLQLFSPNGNGNYVELKAANQSAIRSLIFPNSNGTSGYVLSTNGSGTLSWIAQVAPPSGFGIGDPVTGGTAGSILFVGVGPVLAQNNADLHWDYTNSRLGIRTTTPTATVSIFSPGSPAPALTVDGGGHYSQEWLVGGVMVSHADQFGRLVGGAAFGGSSHGAITGVTNGTDPNILTGGFFQTTGPSGYGPVVLQSGDDKAFRWDANVSGGAHSVLLVKASVPPASPPGNYSWTWTWPYDGGAAGQLLTTDGSGVSTWSPDLYDAGGNVGVGIAVPTSKLHVVQPSTGSFSGYAVYLKDEDATSTAYGVHISTASANSATHSTLWEAAGTAILRLEADGKLVFGAVGDTLTNWYKSATGLLKTDGDVNIAGPGGAGGNVPHELIRRSAGTCNGDGSCPAASACTCTCAANERVVGGGCVGGLALFDSWPSSDNVWSCNYSVATAITAYAICAKY